jgi:hypothetical protein
MFSETGFKSITNNLLTRVINRDFLYIISHLKNFTKKTEIIYFRKCFERDFLLILSCTPRQDPKQQLRTIATYYY